jgi:hypothetical protein
MLAQGSVPDSAGEGEQMEELGEEEQEALELELEEAVPARPCPSLAWKKEHAKPW